MHKDGSIIGNRICENQPLGTQCCSVKYALKCDQVVHRQCFWIAWSFGNVVLAFFSSVHLHKDTRSPNVLPGRMHVHTVPTELFSTIYNSTYTSALCTVSQKLCPIALKFSPCSYRSHPYDVLSNPNSVFILCAKWRVFLAFPMQALLQKC